MSGWVFILILAIFHEDDLQYVFSQFTDIGLPPSTLFYSNKKTHNCADTELLLCKRVSQRNEGHFSKSKSDSLCKYIVTTHYLMMYGKFHCLNW